MFLMKKIVIGSAMLALSLPMIAAASGLSVSNQTKSFSTLMITSGKFAGVCSDSFPTPPGPIVTPAGETSTPVGWGYVQILCMGDEAACSADIFTSNNCEKDTKIGTATLNETTHSLTSISSLNPAQYQLSGSVSNDTLTVTVTQVSAK